MRAPVVIAYAAALISALPATAQLQLASPTEVRRDGNTENIEFADMDGDGLKDLVGFNYERLSWYRNMGGGQFAPPELYAAPNDTFRIGRSFVNAFDADDDGDFDILPNGSPLIILLNDGTGHSTSRIDLDTTQYRAHGNYKFVDLDGNGHVDILSSENPDVAWYPNYGNGSWGARRVVHTYTDSYDGPNATDMDGDGDIDLLLYDEVSMSTGWWENDGTGAFNFVAIIGDVPIVAPFPLDVDNDGDEDILFTDMLGRGLLRRTGPNTLAPAINFAPGCTTDQINEQISVNDFDNDGDMDIYGTFSLMRNMGDTDYECVEIPEFFTPRATAMFDADGDGDLDWFGELRARHYHADSAMCWLENQGGVFNYTGRHYLSLSFDGANTVVIGDVNGDGWNDVLCDDLFDNDPILFRNQGDGTYDPGTRLPDDVNAHSLKLADMDGDGDLDLITAQLNTYLDTLGVQLNDGSGHWGARANVLTDSVIFAVEVADIDRDGDMDIIGGYDTRLWVVRNHGDATFDPPAQLPFGDGTLAGISCYQPEGDTVSIVTVEGTDAANFVLGASGQLSYGSIFSLSAQHHVRDGNLFFYFFDEFIATRIRYSRYTPLSPPGQGFTEQFVDLGTVPGDYDQEFLSDVDGDGDLDLLMAGHGGSSGCCGERYWMVLRERLGELEFGEADTILSNIGYAGRPYAFGDLDHIGTNDLVYCTQASVYLQPIDEQITTGENVPVSVSVSGIKVFPVPAEAGVDLVFDHAIPVNQKLVMCDLTGRVVWSGLGNGGATTSVPRNGLPAGIYVVKANTGSSSCFGRVVFR